jgi:methylated-DNA-protein-cysteine methyltransferase-like protein
MPKENNASFFNLVFEVVKLIPQGKVTNYGAIARSLGSAKSSRMVGWAMNSAHNLPDKIPAHRVVNRNGLLTGKAHFGHADMMQKLLEAEGLTVEDNQIKDFKSFFWDPNKELTI